MNEVFISGEIIDIPIYKFILGSKETAIIKFTIKIQNGNYIQVIAKNEIADYCFQTLEKGRYIYIHGILNTKGQIEIKETEFV